MPGTRCIVYGYNCQYEHGMSCCGNTGTSSIFCVCFHLFLGQLYTVYVFIRSPCFLVLIFSLPIMPPLLFFFWILLWIWSSTWAERYRTTMSVSCGSLIFVRLISPPKDQHYDFKIVQHSSQCRQRGLRQRSGGSLPRHDLSSIEIRDNSPFRWK